MIIETNVIIPNGKYPLAATLVRSTAHNESAAVLLMHGWASNRHEVADIYTRLAQQLAENGIASLRFDFFGNGDSNPECLPDLTIKGMLRDAKAALGYMQKNLRNPIIGLCGFSLGAAVMALLLHDEFLQNAHHITSVVGLSPVVNLTNDMGYRHQRLINMISSMSPDDNKLIEYDLGWRKLLVHPEFVRQFSTLNQVIAEGWYMYKGGCLVIGGELDFSGKNIKNFTEIAPNAKPIRQEFLLETDHIFNALTEHNQANYVIEIATNWFKETLC